MKRIIFFIFMFLCISTFSQVPQLISYQAIIRNSSNNIMSNSIVGMKISILQGSSNGFISYIETHSVITNVNGLASIQIGAGTVVVGDLSLIDWGLTTYYIKTEIDPTGGSNYTISSSTQLISVPYALYAKTSGISDQYFEKEITFDGENNIYTTFILNSYTKVYYNGALIMQNQWSGVGLNSLTLLFGTLKKDKLKVIN